MTRVLIVDDHAIVRRGLRQVLNDASRQFEVGEASSGAEALTMIRNEPWDIVVLDISLPDRSGLEVLKQIKLERPRLPVLMASMHREEQYAVRVLRSGASGYLTKDSPPEQFVAALNRVLSGNRYLTPTLTERLANDFVGGGSEMPHDRLSDREFEILRLIGAGKGMTEIAEQLFLSVKTVSTHRARILQKMGMKNNAELMQYVIRNGLVD